MRIEGHISGGPEHGLGGRTTIPPKADLAISGNWGEGAVGISPPHIRLGGEIELIPPVHSHSRKKPNTVRLHLVVGTHGDEHPRIGAPLGHEHRPCLGIDVKPLEPPDPPARTEGASAPVVKGKPPVVVVVQRNELPGGNPRVLQGRTPEKGRRVVGAGVIA